MRFIRRFPPHLPLKAAFTQFCFLRQLTDEVIRKDKRGVEALQYGPLSGTKDMKEVIVNELLLPKGVKCTTDNVMVVAGGLEGINLTCQVYIDPGDVILVESPTFVHSVEIFEMFEAKCIGVDMDEDGMKMDDLEAKIQKYHPKMIYVIPTFQNPSGRTLSLERRKKVAELSAKYNVLVLEDDPYRDIRYSGEDLPPIKHFDTTGHVVMAGSFSKIFSPGSRLGYVVADTETIQHLVDVKSATNSHTSMLPQILCAEFFKRVSHQIRRTWLRDAEQGSGIHFGCAGRVRLDENHAAAQRGCAGENCKFDRDAVEPDQITASVFHDREIAGMHVQAGKIADDIGQRDKAGEEPEINLVRRDHGAELIGPEVADMARFRSRQCHFFLSVGAIELEDTVLKKRKPVFFRDFTRSAGARTVRHDQSRMPCGSGAEASVVFQKFFRICAASAYKNGRRGLF